MTPRHHLDLATVVSHAAGALPPEASAIVSTHLEGCASCRATMACADGVGGVLVEQQRPAPEAQARARELRASMLQRLDAAPAARPPAGPAAPDVDPDRIPAPLRPYFGDSYRALPWRWMGPGMHFIRHVGSSGSTLLMLRIGPGKRLPMHSHGGSELTQILAGAYDDALGHFGVGDVADLDGDTEHQPVTSPGGPCICVSALDAPLRFSGWLPRKLQSLLGF